MANGRYKFRVGEKAIITADLGDVIKAAQPRRGALDYIEPEYPGRRLNNPVITFYDCAQVKEGLTYRDHPILKVPGYTIGNAPGDLGALYTIDGWGTSDYSDYYDLLFEIPIDDWKDNYKKLEFELNPAYPLSPHVASPATYPTNLLTITPSHAELNVFQDLGVEIATDPTGRTSSLNDLGVVWDSIGLEYRGYTNLKFYPLVGETREWFSMDTVRKDLFEWKVTATNDPDAADVGDLAITGNIDIYLIPHVGLFMAASYLGVEDVPLHDAYDGHNGMQVLGPWYQVMPRYAWPSYFDPYELVDQTLLKETYIAYQKGRTDAIASQWATNGVGVVIPDTLAAADFRTGNNSWKSFIDNDGNTTGAYWSGSAGVYRNSLDWVATDPVLMAVIKMQGSFYYVWSGPVEPDFPDNNLASGESSTVIGYTLSVFPGGDESP